MRGRGHAGTARQAAIQTDAVFANAVAMRISSQGSLAWPLRGAITSPRPPLPQARPHAAGESAQKSLATAPVPDPTHRGKFMKASPMDGVGSVPCRSGRSGCEGCPRLQNAWAVKRVNGAAAASSSARGSAKGRRDQPGLGAPVPRWHYKGFSAVRVRFLGIRRCRARLQHEPLHQVVARSSWRRPLLLARVAGNGCWQVLLQWLLQRRLLATAVRRHCAGQCVQKRAKTRFNVVRVFSL